MGHTKAYNIVDFHFSMVRHREIGRAWRIDQWLNMRPSITEKGEIDVTEFNRFSAFAIDNSIYDPLAGINRETLKLFLGGILGGFQIEFYVVESFIIRVGGIWQLDFDTRNRKIIYKYALISSDCSVEIHCCSHTCMLLPALSLV